MFVIKEQFMGKERQSHMRSLLPTKGDPRRVLQIFVAFSLLSIAVIITLVSLGIHRMFHYYTIHDAKDNSVNIAQVILDQEKKYFVSRDAKGSEYPLVAKENFSYLDQRMEYYLKPFNMYKIKIYDLTRKIVYSTDHGIIGKIDVNNSTLESALKGGIVPQFKKKDHILDLDGESRYDVDVVGTYIPLWGEKPEIIGAFEIYTDATQYRAERRKMLFLAIAVFSVLLFVVFGFLFALMHKLMKELSETRKELEWMATTDGLTGILNRDCLIRRIEEEFTRIARRSDKTAADNFFGAIMLDVDNFKMINDNYGHVAGDTVLKKIALILKNSVREYDSVGRYGGEEFLIILPHASTAEVKAVAERIWKQIREESFEVGSTSSIHITISIGIAWINEEVRDVEEVLKKADQGLYMAKNTGKDRIVWVDN